MVDLLEPENRGQGSVFECVEVEGGELRDAAQELETEEEVEEVEKSEGEEEVQAVHEVALGDLESDETRGEVGAVSEEVRRHGGAEEELVLERGVLLEEGEALQVLEGESLLELVGILGDALVDEDAEGEELRVGEQLEDLGGLQKLEPDVRGIEEPLV